MLSVDEKSRNDQMWYILHSSCTEGPMSENFYWKKKIEKWLFRLLMYLFEFWNYSYVLKLLSHHETSAAGKWKIYLSNLNRQISCDVTLKIFASVAQL